jgi:hypothetical protein
VSYPRRDGQAIGGNSLSRSSPSAGRTLQLLETLAADPAKRFSLTDLRRTLGFSQGTVGVSLIPELVATPVEEVAARVVAATRAITRTVGGRPPLPLAG